MAAEWTCEGPVRGACGVAHRTLDAAVRCIRADQRACQAQGGYSDRSIRRIDRRPLTDAEASDVCDAWSRALYGAH